ncbi:DUF4180 domain-containing protein [Paenibacillus alginolyticus]|uniref:DUF4180 domain-containing protein n=1 Tax=Paenibacillus alginolyticus TaxID=59839 RepID=A0ABT4GQG1_9BACL|nr:DUF4180 domain-containing protein [Paenibacillus alginolyticus]MCY9698286.1 DUF4180 domain-containing protein [Paenibacillus alginolyticus]MEC0145412.1 DUF4180 domain-containing protein [Paenibacillus alginolyticus]
MKLRTVKKNDVEIAVVESGEILITDVQSALIEDFFDLKTRLAGEILQKFINYHVKVAIVGDFSGFSSESLKDFIFECNKGKDIFFLSNEEEAIDKLSRA